MKKNGKAKWAAGKVELAVNMAIGEKFKSRILGVAVGGGTQSAGKISAGLRVVRRECG